MNVDVANRFGYANHYGNHHGNRGNWNRPGWDRPGYGRNGYDRYDRYGYAGYGAHGNWQNNWRSNVVNPRYGWYNGPWRGYWGSSWYAPLAFGGLGWGLGSLTSGWGFGGGYGYGGYGGYGAYSNPYYTQVYAASSPYDYAQPVVVQSYYAGDEFADDGLAAAPQQTPEQQAGNQLFDEGLQAFKAGDYPQALLRFDAALRNLPGDPVVHETRALTLFALGQYPEAAATLNSLLSSAPGMDWTSMSGLYGDPADYTPQFRRLERTVRADPLDASAQFVLAYHYLVTGAKPEAVKALQAVVKVQPRDVVARRMLDALVPPEPTPAVVAAPPAASPVLQDQPAAEAPQTDLVGAWRAKAGDAVIELSIDEQANFAWKADQPGKAPIQLKGTVAAEDDEVVLDSLEQGAMSGTVQSQGPDAWKFSLRGAPASDPGLIFKRVR